MDCNLTKKTDKAGLYHDYFRNNEEISTELSHLIKRANNEIIQIPMKIIKRPIYKNADEYDIIPAPMKSTLRKEERIPSTNFNQLPVQKKKSTPCVPISIIREDDPTSSLNLVKIKQINKKRNNIDIISSNKKDAPFNEKEINISSVKQINDSKPPQSNKLRVYQSVKQIKEKTLQLINNFLLNVPTNDNKKNSDITVINAVDNNQTHKTDYLLGKHNIEKRYKKKIKPNSVMRLNVGKDSNNKSTDRNKQRSELAHRNDQYDKKGRLFTLTNGIDSLKERKDNNDLSYYYDLFKKEIDSKLNDKHRTIDQSVNNEIKSNNNDISTEVNSCSNNIIGNKHLRLESKNHSVSHLLSLELLQKEKGKAKLQIQQEIESTLIEINNKRNDQLNGFDCFKPLAYSDLIIDRSSNKIFLKKDDNINSKNNEKRQGKLKYEVPRNNIKKNNSELKCTYSNNFSIISGDSVTEQKSIKLKKTDYSFNQTQDNFYFNTQRTSPNISKRADDSNSSIQRNSDIKTQKHMIGLIFERKKRNNFYGTSGIARIDSLPNNSGLINSSLKINSIFKEEQYPHNIQSYQCQCKCNSHRDESQYNNNSRIFNLNQEPISSIINSYRNDSSFISRNKIINHIIHSPYLSYLNTSQCQNSLKKNNTNLINNLKYNNAFNRNNTSNKEWICGPIDYNNNVSHNNKNNVSYLCQRCQNEIGPCVNTTHYP